MKAGVSLHGNSPVSGSVKKMGKHEHGATVLEPRLKRNLKTFSTLGSTLEVGA